jgi:hypothetical protein
MFRPISFLRFTPFSVTPPDYFRLLPRRHCRRLMLFRRSPEILLSSMTLFDALPPAIATASLDFAI